MVAEGTRETGERTRLVSRFNGHGHGGKGGRRGGSCYIRREEVSGPWWRGMLQHKDIHHAALSRSRPVPVASGTVPHRVSTSFANIFSAIVDVGLHTLHIASALLCSALQKSASKNIIHAGASKRQYNRGSYIYREYTPSPYSPCRTCHRPISTINPITTVGIE